jgi:hypothetical protein
MLPGYDRAEGKAALKRFLEAPRVKMEPTGPKKPPAFKGSLLRSGHCEPILITDSPFKRAKASTDL